LSLELDHYKEMINEKNWDELNNEKMSLGKLVSDTATRVQELSGNDPARLEEQLDLMKELKAKLSIVIKRLQQLREQGNNE
jgi:hypothetical protein